MNPLLSEIFELEDNNQLDKAYNAYKALYEKDPNNYEVWKHYYFFLWTAIEDGTEEFYRTVQFEHLISGMLEQGKSKFWNLPDFQFIAGYTVSIFPEQYGELDLEEEGKEMLKRAAEMEPLNPLYKMAWLGSSYDHDQNMYKVAESESAIYIKKNFQGKGYLNRYYNQVFVRN